MIEIEWMPPEALAGAFHPQNWKAHSPEQLEALHASVLRYGWLKPALLNVATGHLLNGAGRVEMALRYELPLVPVHRVNVTPAEERDLLLEFDKLGFLREAEPGTLLGLLEEFQASGADGLPLGYSEEDLTLLRDLAQVASPPVLEPLPEYVCVELAFPAAQHERFLTACHSLGERWGLETPAAVLLRALRENAEEL